MKRIAITLILLFLASTLVNSPLAAKNTKRLKAVAEIKKADLDLARAVKTKDMKLFKSLLHEDAAFYGGGELESRDAVAEGWSPFFAIDAETTIVWKPHRVDAAKSGEMGYSLGFFEVRNLNASGDSTYGRYLTIWEKNSRGRWEATLDIGTPPGSVTPERASKGE